MGQILPIPPPLLMFIVLTILIFLNVPVAFALLLTAILFAYVFWGIGGLHVVQNAFWSVMNNWGLIAVPLFAFMGALLERAGIAKEMFHTFYIWLRKFTPGLLIVALLLGFSLGAMSGVAAAGVTAIALLIYPQLVRYKYPKRLSIGTVLASGSLPQLVPPSLNMILYGVVTGVSIGKLFAGGLGMAIVMTVLFAIYIIISTRRSGLSLPPPEKEYTLKEKIIALKYLIGPLIIIYGTLGSIFTGVATPSEAAAIGTFLTLIYIGVRRRLTRDVLNDALLYAARITAMGCFIVAGSYAFSSVFSGIGGRSLVMKIMTSLPYAKVTALVFAIAFVFVLGMFIETASICCILGPMLSPVVEALGYDPVWWGIIFCTTLMTAFISPPVGMSMYYFKGIVKGTEYDVEMSEIYKSTIPFLILMLMTVAIGIAFPSIPMFFVNLFFKG